MVHNNQEERQERLNKLLKKKNKDTTNISIGDKDVNMIKFAEDYLGFKLAEPQKMLLKSLLKNNWDTISFSPIHSYSYSYQSVMYQMLKELLKRKEDK